MKTALITAMVATATVLGASTSHAAGTTNGEAGCVAQITTTEGTPGANVPTIRLYLTPVPGSLFSAIARQDRDACELP